MCIRVRHAATDGCRRSSCKRPLWDWGCAEGCWGFAQASNGSIEVPGFAGNQRLVVTSTGINNESSIVGQDAQDRVESVRPLLCAPATRPTAAACCRPTGADMTALMMC